MTRRLGTPVLAAIAVSSLFTVIGGVENPTPARLAGLLVLAGGWMLALRWRRRARAVPQRWAPGDFAFAPAAPHQPATPQRVAVALSTVETRELAVAASFGAGLGFCVLMVVLFGILWAPDWGGHLPRSMELYPLYAHPLVGMTVIGVHRARTRSRRDETQELFDACPTDQSTRTVGHLLTAWVPAAATLLFLVVLGSLSLANFPTVYGDVGARQVAALLGAGVLAVGGAALGIALARWTPWLLAPVVVLVGIAFGSIRLATRGTSPTAPLRQLSTFFAEPTVDLRFTAPHWVAHHLWIVALVTIVVCIALARDRGGRRLGAVAAIAVVVALVSAVLATRPIDTGDAERIAATLNDLPGHQVCEVAVTVPVCVFPGDEALARHIAAEMRPVIEAAPQGAVEGWTARYGLDTEIADLDPEVRARVRTFPPAERLLPIKVIAHRDADQGARLWTALAAVGVAQAGVDLRGQARGVVALWLATRGIDRESARKMTSTGPIYSEHDPARQRPWPDPCYAGPAPVRWAESDLEAVRQVSALPSRLVGGVVLDQWARLLDPATTTDDLLAALGFVPLGGPRGSTPAPATC